MNTRHSLLALTSASLLAACAVGSTDADIDGDGDDGGGAGSVTTTGAGSGPVTGSGAGTTSGTGGAPTTTGSGAGTTSGTGGAPTTTSGSGGTTSSTSVTSSSSTGGGGNCAHDVCTEGVALTFGCGDPCVDTVCNSDPFCCDAMGGTWDNLCVDGAVQLCGACTMVGTVQPGDLVITEIMNNPSAVTDANGEWFEIYNDAPYAIDLQGLDINHTANNPSAVHTIAQSVVVPSGGYAVLGINASSATNGGVTVDYQYSSGVSLNNTTDYLAIVDGTTVIDGLTWDEASGLDPNGASRSLDPLTTSAVQNDTDQNFCTASSLMSGGDAGTPGAPNDPCP